MGNENFGKRILGSSSSSGAVRWRAVAALGCLLVLIAFASSCSSEREERVAEKTATDQAALDTVITFSIVVPRGLAPEDVLFSSTDALKLNDRAGTVRGSGFFGSVSNSGLFETNVGAQTHVGDIRSRASVTLRSNALVDGFIKTAGTLSAQQGAMIVNGTQQATSLNHETFNWNVGFPTGTVPDVILQPGQIVSRAPGNHGAVIVNAGARLRLRAGLYTMRSLMLEPNSTLELDKTLGPIRIAVRDSFTYRGRLFEGNGRPSNYLIAVGGTGTVFVEAPYTGGALIVPFGTIELKSTPFGHRGQFFAKRIEVHQDARVSHHISGALDGVFTRALTPAPCDFTPCPSGQFRIGLRQCAAPLAQGVACTSTSLCAAGLACISGTCQPAPGPGNICNVATRQIGGIEFGNPDTPCAYDFSSQDVMVCGPDTSTAIMASPYRRCRRPSTIGQRCGEGEACEPGLNCTNGRCQVACSASQACPCGGGGQPLYSCNTSAGICNYCNASLHGFCSNSPGQGCCDGRMGCGLSFTNGRSAQALWGGGGCAFLPGQPCSTSDDCQYSNDTPMGEGPPRSCVGGICTAVFRTLNQRCSMQETFDLVSLAGRSGLTQLVMGPTARNDYCATGHTCDPATFVCKANQNTACTINSDCVQGLTCQGGICAAPPCVAGGSCSVPGARGACRSGTYQCQNNQRVCVSNTTASPEVCDGEDNDCDDEEDEDISGEGAACTATTNPDSCQTGFQVPGTMQCRGTSGMACVPQQCDTNNAQATNCYCTSNGYSSDGNGLPCGLPGATRCTPGVTRCIPNSVCAGAQGQEECRPDVNNCPSSQPPRCWKPTDLKQGLNCYTP